MNSSENITNNQYVIELEKENKILRQTVAELQKLVESYKVKIQELESRVNWFINQIHGTKSEKRIYEDDSVSSSRFEQQKLIELPEQVAIMQEIPEQTITRKKSFKVIPIDNASLSGLRYSKELEVVEVQVANPVTKDLKESEYTVVSMPEKK